MVVLDLRKKMTNKLNKLYESTKKRNFSNEIPEEEFDVFDELNTENSIIKKFMKSFGIGYKIKSFSGERGAVKKTRNILQKFLDADFSPQSGTNELKSKIKDEVQEYKDGKPNITDADIERVARTELSSMREASKLVRWKAKGFTQVKHNAHLDTKTGTKDKEFNGRVFEIDYLIKNPKDRVPLHPNCRCWYTLYK